MINNLLVDVQKEIYFDIFSFFFLLRMQKQTYKYSLQVKKILF